jgi:hypothetical protein
MREERPGRRRVHPVVHVRRAADRVAGDRGGGHGCRPLPPARERPRLARRALPRVGGGVTPARAARRPIAVVCARPDGSPNVGGRCACVEHALAQLGGSRRPSCLQAFAGTLRAALERVIEVGILADSDEDHRVAWTALRDLSAGSRRTGWARERFDEGRLTTELRIHLGPAELATERILRPGAPANADVVRQGGGVVNGGRADRDDRTVDQTWNDRPTESDGDRKQGRADRPTPAPGPHTPPTITRCATWSEVAPGRRTTPRHAVEVSCLPRFRPRCSVRP